MQLGSFKVESRVVMGVLRTKAIPCGSIIMVMSCRTMKFHTLCGTTLAGLLLPWPSSSCTCLAISSRTLASLTCQL
eukprot:5638994-Amphidinium_carterae.1